MPIVCVGLGNPGSEYALTHHNAGFLFLDALADQLGVTHWKEDFEGLVSAVQSPDYGKLILLKPQTYMNASGRSVSACLKFFKLAPQQLVVFHDDLDLKVGVYKVKLSGSHGGHNGLRDIHRALGTDAYRRVRIGIDRPPEKDQVRDYVLSRFTNRDLEDLKICFQSILSNLKEVLPQDE